MNSKSSPFLDGIKRFLGYILVILILFIALLFFIGVIDVMEVLTTLLKVVLILLGLFLFMYIMYHSVIERQLCERNREKSKEVLVSDLGQTNQVSGDTRAGKDTAVTGASILINESELERDLTELEALRELLYIYDFDKLHDYLDKQGRSFLVSGKERLLRRFYRAMHTNESFLKESIMKNNKVDPLDHIKSFISTKETKVQQFRLEDNLTPGGIPFAQLLFKYIVLYTYRIFVTNYILSNQPIIEKWNIDEDGNISRLFSKKFNQDYFKIKLDGPLPYPLRGVITQTEMAIMLSNVDSLTESEAKSINGIREFFTIVGHIIGERVYIFDIVQNQHRQTKTVRELYQTYIHVFKKEEVCTAPVRRWINDQRVELHKTSNSIQSFMIKFTRKNSWNRNLVQRKIDVNNEKIFRLKERNTQLSNKGYLKLYLGVYSNLEDVKKTVRFPRFNVKLESVNEKIISKAFGFTMCIRKDDSYGRFNTHFMEWVKEIRQNKYSMHFEDIENWSTLFPDDVAAISTGYGAMQDLAVPKEAKLKDLEKKKEQINLLLEVQEKNPQKFRDLLKKTGVFKEVLEVSNKKKRARIQSVMPELDNLTQKEIIIYAHDLGINAIPYSDYSKNTIVNVMKHKKKYPLYKWINHLTTSEVAAAMNDIELNHYQTYREGLHQLIYKKHKQWHLIEEAG